MMTYMMRLETTGLTQAGVRIQAAHAIEQVGREDRLLVQLLGTRRHLAVHEFADRRAEHRLLFGE